MPNFNKPSFNRKPFGKKPFGNKSFGNKGNFDRGSREMFKANCASCGEVCEVPFRPNGTRPVYCSNCFVKDSPAGNRPPRRDFGQRPSFERSAPQVPRPDQAFNDLKAELRVVNKNLERLITLLTPTPTQSKEAEPKAVKAQKAAKKTTKKKSK